MLEVLPREISLSLMFTPSLLAAAKMGARMKVVLLLLTLMIQTMVFFALKRPNCYEAPCPELGNNNVERWLYYEKY